MCDAFGKKKPSRFVAIQDNFVVHSKRGGIGAAVDEYIKQGANQHSNQLGFGEGRFLEMQAANGVFLECAGLVFLNPVFVQARLFKYA